MKILSNIFTSAKSKIQAITRRITDPIRLKGELTQDVVDLSPDAIATRLMNEVREYGKQTGFETARVIDRNGEVLKYDLEETPNAVSIKGKSMLHLVYELEDAHYIHNHNINVPLSTADLLTMVEYHIAKMTATTPNGGISSIELPDKLKYKIIEDKIIHPEISLPTVLKDIAKMCDDEIEILKKLGIYYEDEEIAEQALRNSPEHVTTLLANYRNELIQKFAEKYGFKYTYTE